MRLPDHRKSSLTAGILNLLFPACCPACGGPPDRVVHAPFCSSCWSSVTKYTGPACRRCATPFVSDQADICSECMKSPPPFSQAVSFGIYDGILASAIHHFKFDPLRRMHKPLAALLAECDVPAADAVIPVPLTVQGLRRRGFNQALLLAARLAKLKKIRLVTDGLIKVRETAPQVGLPARERQKNLRGAFRSDNRISGLRLLLVDDVMTTGATARECSGELLKAGAGDVHVLTLARAGTL